VGARFLLGEYGGTPSSRLLNGTVEIFLNADVYFASFPSVFIDPMGSPAPVYLHIR
jgi:hypothetical protein